MLAASEAQKGCLVPICPHLGGQRGANRKMVSFQLVPTVPTPFNRVHKRIRFVLPGNTLTLVSIYGWLHKGGTVGTSGHLGTAFLGRRP